MITRPSQLIFRGVKWGHERDGERRTRVVTFAITCRAAKLQLEASGSWNPCPVCSHCTAHLNHRNECLTSGTNVDCRQMLRK